MNSNASHLLFRDKRRALFLASLEKGKNRVGRDEKVVLLLEHCQYAQWIPDCDVILAQNDHSLFVWYTPDDREAKEIATDLEESQILGIERENMKWCFLCFLSSLKRFCLV